MSVTVCHCLSSSVTVRPLRNTPNAPKSHCAHVRSWPLVTLVRTRVQRFGLHVEKAATLDASGRLPLNAGGGNKEGSSKSTWAPLPNSRTWYYRASIRSFKPWNETSPLLLFYTYIFQSIQQLTCAAFQSAACCTPLVSCTSCIQPIPALSFSA